MFPPTAKTLEQSSSLEDFARDSLLIRHRLEDRHVLSQMLFVNPSRHSFPPRSGIARRLPEPRPSLAHSAASYRGLLAPACESRAPAAARSQAPLPDVPSAPPWRSLADQNDLRGRLAHLREDGPSQDRVIPVARFAAVGGPRAIELGHAPLTRIAPWALQSIRMETPFEPFDAYVLVEEFVDRKVNHGSEANRFAVKANMSRNFERPLMPNVLI
jgi:hypothetical protein